MLKETEEAIEWAGQYEGLDELKWDYLPLKKRKATCRRMLRSLQSSLRRAAKEKGFFCHEASSAIAEKALEAGGGEINRASLKAIIWALEVEGYDKALHENTVSMLECYARTLLYFLYDTEVEKPR